MDKKLKLITMIGTRPEIIKLSETIKKADKYFDHVLVHTGQNWDYTLNEIFFEELELRKPNYFLETVGTNLGETMGNILTKSYDLFLKEKPDAILILGDTNSALSAISAKRLKIPIFHMEAGNRCFDQNVPEEINRTIVDHISDVNLPYSEHAKDYLFSEGVSRARTFVTGSPMREIVEIHKAKIDKSDVLTKLKLKKDGYFIVSAHREENIDNPENFKSLMSALNQIAEKYKMPIIFSTHPRTMKQIEKSKIKLNPLITNMKPFGFFDYNKLQLDSFCVLSDSGTLAEEGTILGLTGVSLRTSTERPEVVDKGAFIIGGIKSDDVLQAVELARGMKNNNETALSTPAYEDNNVSIKVIKIIQSFTKIVNKNVWDKR